MSKPQIYHASSCIRIHAVSLNYRDQVVLKGEFGTRLDQDLVPNSDGAGEINTIGAGLTTWAIELRDCTLPGSEENLLLLAT